METLLQTKNGYRSMWIRYAVMVLVTELCGIGLGLALRQFVDRSWFTYVLTILQNYVIGFTLIYFLLKRLPAEKPEAARMTFGGLIAAFLICGLFSDAATFIFNPVVTLVKHAFGRSTETLNNVQTLIVSGDRMWNLIVVIILGPVFEELIFRKLLIDRVYRYGEVLAVVASALAFGLFHQNISQIFYTACMGLVLAYVYCRTGNIFYSIGLHIAFNLLGNFTGSTLAGVNLTELAQMGTNVTPEMAAALVPFMLAMLLKAVLDIAGLIVLIHLLRKKKVTFRATSLQTPKGKGLVAFANIGFILYLAIVTVFTVLYM